MADRMAEALTLGAPRAAAVDVLAPAPDATPAGEPDDVLSELLTAEPAVSLAPDDIADILLLDRMKREKGRYEQSAAALGKDIERVQGRLIELGVELGLIDNRGRLALGAVDDGQGFMVNPYEVRTIWPKYRENPDTDQSYTRDELVKALRENGLGRLVVESTEQYAYPGYIRDRVKAWRRAAGAAGVRDDQGRYLDHDGELLDAEEARDPVADILALPRWLRAIVEPVDKIALQFSRRRIDSPAVEASDAAEAAAAPPGD